MAKAKVAKKKVTKKAPPPPNMCLAIQVLQNGVVQVSKVYRLDTLFVKKIKLGNNKKCDLYVPHASLPEDMFLFNVGKGNVSMRVDPRLDGFVYTGTKMGRVTDLIQPQGALAELATVSEPMLIELKKEARGSVKVFGYEIIFKVYKKVQKRPLPSGLGAGRVFFPKSETNTIWERLATPIAFALALLTIIPAAVWFLNQETTDIKELRDLPEKYLMEFIHPKHYQILPAIFREELDEVRPSSQVVHWISEFQSRQRALELGEIYKSDIDLLGSFPTESNVGAESVAWWENARGVYEQAERYRTAPSSPRFYQYQKPYFRFLSRVSGDTLGSVHVRQSRRIQDIERSYEALRSLVKFEHNFLKKHYAAQEVQMGKLFEVPKTNRLLGAQPEEEFSKERYRYMLGQLLAEKVVKTKTKNSIQRQLRNEKHTSDYAPVVWLSPSSFVVPEYLHDGFIKDSSNLWHNARLAVDPSLIPPAPKPKATVNMQEVEMLIFSKREQVKACYDSALRRRGDLQGTLTMQWWVSLSGTAENVRVSRSTIKDEAFVSCVSKRIQSWRFPKPRNGSVLVTYPFQFMVSADNLTR